MARSLLSQSSSYPKKAGFGDTLPRDFRMSWRASLAPMPLIHMAEATAMAPLRETPWWQCTRARLGREIVPARVPSRLASEGRRLPLLAAAVAAAEQASSCTAAGTYASGFWNAR